MTTTRERRFFPAAAVLPSTELSLRIKNGIVLSSIGVWAGGLLGALGGLLAGWLLNDGSQPSMFMWVGCAMTIGGTLFAILGLALRPTGSTESNQAEVEDGTPSSFLKSEDFAAVGVMGAKSPRVNSPGPNSAFVVFAGLSGATGGIEFDVFLSPAPETVFAHASGEFTEPIRVREVDADDAVVATGLDNGRGGKWAGLAARKGALVFCIGIPDSPQSRAQLIALAKLVLARAQRVAESPAAGAGDG